MFTSGQITVTQDFINTSKDPYNIEEKVETPQTDKADSLGNRSNSADSDQAKMVMIELLK